MELKTMPSRLIAAALLGTALIASPVMAQNAANGVRFKQIKQEAVVDADGRHTTIATSQIQVLTAAAASQFAQSTVRFNASLEDVEVLEAYTLKPDGRKLTVDPANIITQKMPQTIALAPLYTDAEQKIVIFPNVEAGDTLVLTDKFTQKLVPLPGQLTLSHYFGRAVAADDTSFTLTVPKSIPLKVSSHEVTPDISAHGDTTIYRWTFSNPTAKATPATLVYDPDAGPHLIVSSFPDYDAFAHAFAGIIVPKVAVTPEIQKQADTITAGITDRKQQARALYDWANSHVRYVGIELGAGGYVPHDPNWTLTNAFGDCKDQAVLLASLLKAKNIPAELVLIHAGNHYKLSALPTPGDFNHMILFLPDWNLYVDTTVPGMPFQMLPVGDYGKPVVHLVPSGAAQHKTPMLPPELLSSTYKVHAVENSEGRFDVDVSISATGPWAASLRRLGDVIATSGNAPAAAALLKAHNFPNATGTLSPAPASTVAASYTINGSFHAARPPAGGNMQSLERGLQLLGRAGDGPMGPLNNTTITAGDETPCYSGQQTEDIDFQFANGDRLAAMPTDTHIKTGNIAYDTKWTVSGDTVSLHRTFTARLNEPTCSGKLREETALALEKIRNDYAQQARIEHPEKPVEPKAD
jgi:transglutaminase-like putative cysteine protease